MRLFTQLAKGHALATAGADQLAKLKKLVRESSPEDVAQAAASGKALSRLDRFTHTIEVLSGKAKDGSATNQDLENLSTALRRAELLMRSMHRKPEPVGKGRGYNPNRGAGGRFTSGGSSSGGSSSGGDLASSINDVLSGRVKATRKEPQRQVLGVDWDEVSGMNEAYTQLEELGMKRHAPSKGYTLTGSGEVVENADDPYRRTGYLKTGNDFAHAVNHLRKKGFERREPYNPKFRGTVLGRGQVEVTFSSGFGGSHHVEFLTNSKARKR